MSEYYKGQVYKVWYFDYDNPTQLEAWLDKQYHDGWELVSFSGQYFVLKIMRILHEEKQEGE